MSYSLNTTIINSSEKQKPDNVVILCHGYGGDGNDISILANYWKNNLQFEKLILDYDTYNPDKSLNAHIILVMPEIVSPWSATFTNEVETRFNNMVQSTDELIEVEDITIDATLNI